MAPEQIMHKAPPANAKYNRILLKLSGEALLGGRDNGMDPETVNRVAQEIKDVVESGIEVCVVIGGGNIFRGVSGALQGIDRTTGDHMGMLGTVINALAMQNALEHIGIVTRVQSAIKMESICEPYIRRRAMRHMQKGRVVIFAAGTGNPFFTTDSAAALRAAEMDCDAIFKGTKVDGVYDADPKKNPNAKRFDNLTHMDALQKELGVMDASAISLAKDSKMPIVVFNIHNHGAFADATQGKGTFTVVS